MVGFVLATRFVLGGGTFPGGNWVVKLLNFQASLALNFFFKSSKSELTRTFVENSRYSLVLKNRIDMISTRVYAAVYYSVSAVTKLCTIFLCLLCVSVCAWHLKTWSQSGSNVVFIFKSLSYQCMAINIIFIIIYWCWNC